MKTTLSLTLVLAAIAMASGITAPLTELPNFDIVPMFSQEYQYSAITGGFGGIDDKIADDFILTDSGVLDKVIIWTIYDPSPASSIQIQIRRDNGDMTPHTSTLISSQMCPCTQVDTGDDISGYDIYETTLDLPVPISLDSNERYWLVIDIPVQPVTWVLGKELEFGSTVWIKTSTIWETSMDKYGRYSDLFFELIPVEAALERDSWGSIKASF